MSEFDLIEQRGLQGHTSLSVTARHLNGHASIPVFELCVAAENSDFPKQPYLPGWQELEVARANIFEWDGRSLTWQSKDILQSHRAPTLCSVTLADLPGLQARTSDKLPSGHDKAIRWTWELPEGVNLYGLGQRSGPMERRGLTASNWTTDSPTGHGRTTDPLYQAHPLLWGVTDDCWWAWLYQHPGYSRFDLGQSELQKLESLTLGDTLTLQVHAASSPEQLLKSLRQTLGAPSPPPLWSLGFHQSRWGYKSADEVSTLIDTFRDKELALDVVHLDIDYMDDYRSFTFHPERFPEPKKQFEEWSQKEVKVVTIIDPGLKFDTSGDYEALSGGLEGEHFIKSNSGAPQVGYCWPDEALFPDFCQENTRDWWAELSQFYFERGVSGLWIDMNEPAIFDSPFWTGKATQHPMPLDTPWGDSIHLKQRNLYGSLMAQATHSAWKDENKRPWVLTRSGFTGVSHHAWSWMGDNTSWWEHLALSLPQLSSMALVNSAFVGVDIGGFFGHCPGDLYSAWIEASVIYPFMRAHSAMGTSEQHPWSFGPEVEAVAQKALQLRYRLLPYIYSASVHHCQGDLPPLRPVFFDYPDDKRFRYTEDQVMFGPHMMACPFLHRGKTQRMVQLPEGKWYDFHTGVPVLGQSLIIDRNPGLVPLFVKAGAVIPWLAKNVQSSAEALKSPWELKYFPGEEELVSKVYWDSGDGPVNVDGKCLRLVLQGAGQKFQVLSKHTPHPYESLVLEALRQG